MAQLSVHLQSAVTKRSIQWHYDLATAFYWLMWGSHVHHGLWEGNETPKEAQLQLTHRLAQLAGVQQGDRILDVGCGMGGSSIELAKRWTCSVQGITLSPFQRLWAATSAKLQGVGKAARFSCCDAENIDFAPASFDVLWSIECTEHLFNKAAFFQKAAHWIRPGGRLAICAWLAAESPRTQRQQQLVDQVCEGFLCPSLGSAGDYEQWFRSAGLTPRSFHDWTDKVVDTWEICKRRVKYSGVGWLAPFGGRSMRRFLADFDTILTAYRTGAMRYGCFIADSPMKRS